MPPHCTRAALCLQPHPTLTSHPTPAQEKKSARLSDTVLKLQKKMRKEVAAAQELSRPQPPPPPPVPPRKKKYKRPFFTKPEQQVTPSPQ